MPPLPSSLYNHYRCHNVAAAATVAVSLLNNSDFLIIRVVSESVGLLDAVQVCDIYAVE
jgi:hypothetical protein